MKEMKLSQFIDFKYIQNMRVNKPKNQMAFVVSKADVNKNEYLHDLWLSDGSTHEKILKLKASTNYLFETDDTLLIEYTKNKLEEQRVKDDYRSIYYRYNIHDKSMSLAYEFPFKTTIVSALSNYLLLQASLTADEHQLYLLEDEKRNEYIKELKKQQAYVDIDEVPFYFNGNGFTANKRSQLFLYDKHTKHIRPIVDDSFNVGIVKVSDDLNHIYYTGTQSHEVKSLTTHIFVYHLENNRTEILYHEDNCSVSNMYIMGNQIIIAGTDMKDFGINQNPDFFTLKHKKLELLTVYRQSLGNSIGSDVRLGGSAKEVINQDKLYFVSTVDDHSEVYSLNHDGSIKCVFVMQGSIDGLVVLNDQFYAIGLYKQKLQELYLLDFTNNKQTQITNFNQNSLKNMYVAKPKEILYKKDNHLVKGFVLFPKDYDDKKKYPLILDIHGGPKTVYGTVYYHEMQYWANLGYFVLFGNPRGSDGKGDVFADIRGKYGTIDYEDLMNLLNTTLDKYHPIDKEKLFVTGGSYGGFMTNWIVGHTDRFKAAVTQRSISNWLSFHGTSDIGFYFSKDQTAGHPLVDTEKLWHHSPIKYAKNMKTPLLIIHSDLDYRCPIEQAMQLFTVLKEQKVKTKFVWFKGETHELSRSGKPQARIKRLNEITQWFEHYR